MIITQRGYQANTKVITTSDSLLNTTISIKR
jgi:flagellar hook protein FlgE